MGAIPLDEVRSGMILERDVVIPPDRLLLVGGVALTEAHLTLLRVWGVAEIEVRGVTRGGVLEQVAGCLEPGRRQALEAEVAEMFRHAGQHPAVVELQRLVTLRRMRRDARSHGHED